MKSLVLALSLIVALPAGAASRTSHLDEAVKIASTRLQGDVCKTEAFQPAILAQLSAYSMEASVLSAAVQKYPVLAETLATNYSFKRLLAGVASKRPSLELFTKLIVGTHFENHLGGDNGPGAVLAFEAAGVVQVGHLVAGQMVMEAGTYALAQVGHVLRVSVVAPGQTPVVYTSGESTAGVEDLLVEVGATGEPAVFSSSPWECEN